MTIFLWFERRSRLHHVRRLLLEAAMLQRRVTFSDEDTRAYAVFNLGVFLHMAFREPWVECDYLWCMWHAHAKSRAARDPAPTCAKAYISSEILVDYLEQLAKRIRVSDLDSGFVLPKCYGDFVSCQPWPRNAWPAKLTIESKK